MPGDPEVGPASRGGQQRNRQEGYGRGKAAKVYPRVQQTDGGQSRGQGPGGHQRAEKESHPGRMPAKSAAEDSQIRQQQYCADR